VSLQQFGKPVKNSLSLIINQYKGSVTRFARKNGYNNFSWQSRFYDHIIRNGQDLFRIRTYIKNNPLKWELDEYYSIEESD
jgi:REP element-mobilizing transposase RayT